MDALNVMVEYDTVQYIVIKIGDEQYGIDIKYVENIVRLQKITRVPNVQEYFKGVINLRGEVVPVMSLRVKMGLEPDEYTNTSRIIIVKMEANAAVGVLVDEVKEVVTLSENNIEHVSKSSRGDSVSYINGIGKSGENLISLLDLSMVITEKDNQ